MFSMSVECKLEFRYENYTGKNLKVFFSMYSLEYTWMYRVELQMQETHDSSPWATAYFKCEIL